MTENEAIKVIETEKQCVLRNSENGCDRDCICCDLIMPENDIICGYDTAIKSLEEIQQYREIGTVEEYREAREKQTWNIITEDVDSYPECFKYVLVEDEYGDKNIAYCDTEFDWFVSNCENNIKLIGEVVRWIEID